MNNSNVRVSVVIAAWPDATGLSNCLDSLEGQRDDEIEVITALTTDAPMELRMRFNWVHWLEPSADALIPHLWSKGIAAARGEIVAITIGQFVPASDWLALIRDAHQRLSAAGIGGAIDPSRDGSVVDWATYFLRYSKYFKYKREQTVNDIAGDNASYKREAIASHWKSLSSGFWEQELHARVLAAGQSLAFVPAIRVSQGASFGIRDFCAQRFHHGRRFGRDRMREKSLIVRMAGVLAAPLILVMLLGKISRNLTSKPSYVGPFLCSLPVVFLFSIFWAAGETCGYITARAQDPLSLAAAKRLQI